MVVEHHKLAELLLSVLLALTLCCFVPQLALADDAAEGSFTMEVGEAKNNDDGSVSVPVIFSDCPGVMAFKLDIAYDTNAYTLKSVESVDNLPGSFMANTEGDAAVITWFSLELTVLEGEVFTLVFAPNDTSVDSSSAVMIEYDQEDILGEGSTEIEAEVQNGFIETPAFDVAAKIGDVAYSSLSQALADAKAGDVVRLTSNAEEKYTIVSPGVTLDLGGYDLTADYVIGLNGSFLTATPSAGGVDGGKLFVGKDSISLPEQGYTNDNGQYVLPVWDPNQECFVFSLFVVNTSTANRGLFVYEEDETIYFQFKHQATTAINNSLLVDGSSDNELSVIFRLEWDNENGAANQDFVYSDSFVGAVTGAFEYTFTLEGYGAFIDDVSKVKATAMVVTESGATAFGQTWMFEDSKA